jgi:hypothetical protein
MRWNRIAMGLRPSPYYAVQIMAWLDETVFGYHLDQDNVFRWGVVELNLMGMPSYSTSKPWVYKNRSSDGRIATDCSAIFPLNTKVPTFGCFPHFIVAAMLDVHISRRTGMTISSVVNNAFHKILLSSFNVTLSIHIF